MNNNKFIQNFLEPFTKADFTKDGSWFEPYKTMNKQHGNLSCNYNILYSYSAPIAFIPPPCDKQPFHGKGLIFITDYDYSNTTRRHLYTTRYYIGYKQMLCISLFLPRDIYIRSKLMDLSKQAKHKVKELCLDFEDLYKSANCVRKHKLSRWLTLSYIASDANLLKELFELEPTDISMPKKANILYELLFFMKDKDRNFFENKLKEQLAIHNAEAIIKRKY